MAVRLMDTGVCRSLVGVGKKRGKEWLNGVVGTKEGYGLREKYLSVENDVHTKENVYKMKGKI